MGHSASQKQRVVFSKKLPFVSWQLAVEGILCILLVIGFRFIRPVSKTHFMLLILAVLAMVYGRATGVIKRKGFSPPPMVRMFLPSTYMNWRRRVQQLEKNKKR
jgi:purine-cytosine permease-like protein